MMTIQHVLGMTKSYTEKSVAVLKNVAYITFMKSIPHCINGENHEQHNDNRQSTVTYFKVQRRKK